MGIRHEMTGREVGEAVPPPYARYLAGLWLMAREAGW